MGLFSRKRPPVYTWNDEWEPVYLDLPVDNHALSFSWTHPDDYHSQLISLSWTLWMEGIRHTVVEWWNVLDGSRVMFTFGFRTANDNGLRTTVANVTAGRSLSQLGDEKSYQELPDYCYLLPGHVIRWSWSGNLAGDELRAVRIYFKRWMIR